MNENLCCRYSRDRVHEMDVVYLENEFLKVGILTGKGTDIFTLFYKPRQMDVLMKTKEGLAAFSGRDFRRNRLKHYAEIYAGGWQEILPNRAMWEGGCITQEEEGESAGVPWDCELVENNPRRVSLRCCVRLPVTPLYIEKTFTLLKGLPVLFIREKVRYDGSGLIHFIWTHHPAFGGDFLDENARVSIPGGKAFRLAAFESDRQGDISRYGECLEKVTLPDGTKANLLEVNPSNAGIQMYIPVKDLKEGRVELLQHKKGLGARLKWDLETFPHLRYWARSDQDVYTVALEPSSSFFSDIHDCIRYGGCVSLRAGEEKETFIECEVFTI